MKLGIVLIILSLGELVYGLMQNNGFVHLFFRGFIPLIIGISIVNRSKKL